MTQNTNAAPATVQALGNPHSTADRTDGQLLLDFLSRSDEPAESAFTALVERHGPIVQRVCLDVLGNRDEAHDAAQAVFLVLARKARSIRKPESLGPWLHGVALRVARHGKREAASAGPRNARKPKPIASKISQKLGLILWNTTNFTQKSIGFPKNIASPSSSATCRDKPSLRQPRLSAGPSERFRFASIGAASDCGSRLSRAGIGLIAFTSSDLTKSLSLPTGTLDREWSQTTARAAVRFAAGKATTGLIAPPVAGLASSVLTAMVGDSLKVLSLIVISSLIAAAGLSFIWRKPAETRTDTSLSAATTTTAAPLIDSVPAPITAAPKSPGTLADRRDQPPPPLPPGEPKTQAATQTPPSTPAAPAQAPQPPDQTADRLTLSRPYGSRDRSRSLALLDRRPKEAPGLGRELFERVWGKDDPRGHGGDGLGPVFNGQSCVICHNQGGSGGAGALDRNIEIVTATGGDFGGYSGFSYSFSMDLGAGRFDYRMGGDPNAASGRETQADPRLAATIHPGFQQSRSVVLHRYGTDPAYNAWRESLPGRHGPVLVRSSERNPPPLFGIGRIDAIPDEAIEAAAKRRSSSSAQVKGRVSRLKDGRIGRFGWKAQTATLEEFVLSAAAGEMGLEIPGRRQAADPRLPGFGARGLDMDQDECNLLVEFVRGLTAPIEASPADEKAASQRKAGEATFKTIGCASCHLPKLGDVDGIYSDLLLHDMGPQLGDADVYTVFSGEPARPAATEPADRSRPGTGIASAREWRTPPLWGLQRLRPLPARRSSRRDRRSHHDARRPGHNRSPALRRASPQTQTATRSLPHLARPSFPRMIKDKT